MRCCALRTIMKFLPSARSPSLGPFTKIRLTHCRRCAVWRFWPIQQPGSPVSGDHVRLARTLEKFEEVDRDKTSACHGFHRDSSYQSSNRVHFQFMTVMVRQDAERCWQPGQLL